MKKELAAFALAFVCIFLTSCKSQAGGQNSSEASKPASSAVIAAAEPASSAAPSSSEASSSQAASSQASSGTASSSSAPAERQTVQVTIPEGYAATQIASLLEKNGVCTASAFLSTLTSYNFSYYPLVSQIPNDPRKCYRLEGYLYPNTYEFYQNMKPQDAIGKMLRSAESSINGKYGYPGMTTDQLITLASIIQKEAPDFADMKKISSVLHNRLKAKMPLQADSTVYYLTKYLSPDLCEKYKQYYNTVKRIDTLPAGPICNPGADALRAAASPENTDYLYFCSDASNHYYYAATYAEQQANLKRTGVSAAS